MIDKFTVIHNNIKSNQEILLVKKVKIFSDVRNRPSTLLYNLYCIKESNIIIQKLYSIYLPIKNDLGLISNLNREINNFQWKTINLPLLETLVEKYKETYINTSQFYNLINNLFFNISFNFPKDFLCDFEKQMLNNYSIFLESQKYIVDQDISLNKEKWENISETFECIIEYFHEDIQNFDIEIEERLLLLIVDYNKNINSVNKWFKKNCNFDNLTDYL